SPQQTQGTDASTGADTDTDIDPMTQAEDSSASSSTRVAQRPCRRHRRNSDAFIDNKMLAMHHTAFDEDDDNDGNNSDDERSSIASDCSRNSGECRVLGRTLTHHHHGMVSDTEDARRISGRRSSTDHMASSHATGRSSESPGNRKLHQQRFQQSARRLRAAATMHRHSSMKASVSRALQETIRGNTQEEPMSSVKALRIFNTLFPATVAASHDSSDDAESSEHDPSCKQCVSEAMVAAHKAAAGGVQHGDAAHSELRMNLGAGRNAVYVAPCERHLECPLEKKGKYLIHTNKPKIM
ncbi:hypothetical protein GGI05_006892, partial [Coemansia sp. RSA 2603]